MIHEYGGSPVYAGGDDLLFFAPVSMVQARKPDDEQGYHILHLLEILNDTFKNYLKEYAEHNPSLSFGVSVTYYAFPMGEALEQAQNMLFARAKKASGKNAIALAIQKHSGTVFGGIYRLNSASFRQFHKIMQHDPGQDKEIELLKSVTYTLRANEGLLELIGKDDAKVGNFMRNSFNERIHLENGSLKLYLQWIMELIPVVYDEAEHIKSILPCNNEAEKSMHQLYGMLRAVSFLKGEEL